MSNVLTGIEVWEAAQREPSFAAEFSHPGLMEAVRPFIEQAPVALAEHLDKKACLESFFVTRIAFLDFCLKNGMGDVVGKIVGMSGESITGILSEAMSGLQKLFPTIEAVLKQQGVTEDQAMLGPSVGFSEANKTLYRAGTLTIAEVLRTQPGCILSNKR